MSDEHSNELEPLQVRVDRWVSRSTYARLASCVDVNTGRELVAKFRYSIPLRPMATIEISGSWVCHFEFDQILIVRDWSYVAPKPEQTITQNLNSLGRLHG